MSLTNEDKEWMANVVAASETRTGTLIANLIAESETRTSGLIAASETRTSGLIAASEARTSGLIAASEARTSSLIAASETRSTAAIERVETALLTEFHKWAPKLELRVKSHGLAIQALDLEIDNLGARLTKLEPKQ